MSGYIIKNIIKKITCEFCLDLLIDHTYSLKIL